MKEVTWNPWHGCHKISPGCQHCYVYRTDAKFDKDSSRVVKTTTFNLPVRRARSGEYKLTPGTQVFTCFSSDFLVEEADQWREEAWRMMACRRDLWFFFITKRIDRLAACLPSDWGDGYPNVSIGCTVENQERADYRLPIFLSLPIRRRTIICEPLLEPISLSPYLAGGVADLITGGESGPDARICNYDWVLDLRRQCVEAGVAFRFKQTGARFVKDGRLYRIKRRFQHSQARKAKIDFTP